MVVCLPTIAEVTAALPASRCMV